MATTIDHFGDSGLAETTLSSFIGIPSAALAGDVILVVAVGGVSGDGLTEPTPSDNVGTATWLKIDDQSVGVGADEIRATWWRLTCDGGEDTVNMDWVGASDVCMAGVLARTPTLPVPYLIGSGPLVWNGSQMRFNAGSPTSNGQTYVALAATATTDVVSSSIVAPPGDTSAGGASNSGVNSAIADANNNEGAHTTSDVLQYRITPRMDDGALVAIFGFDADPGALSGHGEFILGGSAELTISGEPLPVEATGRFVGGEGRLRAPAPVPPPPEVDPANVLGCGVYDVYGFTRGLGFIVGNLEFDEIQWNRQLDATSTTTLTIDGVSNLGALERCCAVLGELEPFVHELGIYRAIPGTNIKKRVWSGPITRMRFPSEQAIIEAFDLSGWLTRRTLHQNHNFVEVDLINMWVAWVQDAMAVENSAGVYPVVVALSGILGDRLTTIVDHSYAADAIAEIATTGIDWTTVDRIMRAGPVLPQPAFDAIDNLPLLIDESFRVAPEIIVDGLDGANCWFVQGGGTGGGGGPIFGEYGPAFAATPDHVAQPAAPDYAAIEDEYGRLEQMTSETRILDQASIDQAAQTRYALGKRLVPFITGGALLPTAPLPIDEIIPGALVRVHLARACKPVDATMRIKSLTVTAQSDGAEDVNIGLEPIGSVAPGG